MTHPFYKAFEQAPYPCYWLANDGGSWRNEAALELEHSGGETSLLPRLLGIIQQGQGGSMPSPALTDALRLGGITIMPLDGGLFVTCPVGGVAPMQAMSHQLREPLTNIYATLPLIAKKLEDEDQIYAQQIQDNCYSLLRTVTNLESCARLEARSLPARPVDLAALVDSLVVCARSVCRGHGVEILRHVPEEPVVVLGDAAALGEAVLNILRNSLQYTRDGNEINVRLFTAGGRAVLTVEDRGLGILPKHIEHIFEPYYSRDPYGDSPEAPGLGLGLAVAAATVRSLGGTIAVESRFGEGTGITLSLPLAPSNGGNVLGSEPADYLLNRYSAIYVQLSGLCRLPVV